MNDRVREWTVRHIDDGVLILGHNRGIGSFIDQELKQFIVSKKCGAVQSRVAFNADGFRIDSEFEAILHGFHPIWSISTEVRSPTEAGGNHQRSDAFKGRQLWIGACFPE